MLSDRVNHLLLELWKSKTFEIEDQFQKESITLISNFFPEFAGKVYHTPNELFIPKRINESQKSYEARTKQIGSLNRAKGKLSGFPDIGIKYKGILYCNELKLLSEKNKKDGGLSQSQIELHQTFNLDFPEIPVFVSYTLYDVYVWCFWILKSGFHIVKS